MNCIEKSQKIIDRNLRLPFIWLIIWKFSLSRYMCIIGPFQIRIRQLQPRIVVQQVQLKTRIQRQRQGRLAEEQRHPQLPLLFWPGIVNTCWQLWWYSFRAIYSTKEWKHFMNTLYSFICNSIAFFKHTP